MQIIEIYFCHLDCSGKGCFVFAGPLYRKRFIQDKFLRKSKRTFRENNFITIRNRNFCQQCCYITGGIS